MTARLGEMLVKVGVLTSAQLEQVLNAQAVYGGRLGTNLVEMGMVGEDELARVLNEKLGVPCVAPATLNALSKELLSLIPAEVVERYRVLPVALEGKKLTLAMADPTDYKAIEEIGFITGLVIRPRVCSELRLNLALEHYFGIKRAMRYIPVQGGFRSRFTIVSEYEDGDTGGEANQEVVARGSRVPRVPLKELSEQFAGATKEGELVTALLGYLDGEFDRAALLTLKPGVALGVKGVAEGAEIAALAGCAIPLDDARELKEVAEEGRLYLGELTAKGAEGKLLRAMEAPAPAPALLMPLSVAGQVAALVCVQDLGGRLAGGVFDLRRVAAMAELTFEMICLKRKIASG